MIALWTRRFVTRTDEQEVEIDTAWIDSSEELGVDEFMKYRDSLH